MLRLFEAGIGHDIPEIRHTTWTALNAVTEYTDHYRSTRGKSATDLSQQSIGISMVQSEEPDEGTGVGPCSEDGELNRQAS